MITTMNDAVVVMVRLVLDTVNDDIEAAALAIRKARQRPASPVTEDLFPTLMQELYRVAGVQRYQIS